MTFQTINRTDRDAGTTCSGTYLCCDLCCARIPVRSDFDCWPVHPPGWKTTLYKLSDPFAKRTGAITVQGTACPACTALTHNDLFPRPQGSPPNMQSWRSHLPHWHPVFRLPRPAPLPLCGGC